MICNPTKTELIVFGNPNQECIDITLDKTVVSAKKTMKVLGIIFDNQLSWRENTSKILSKCSSVAYSIRLLNRILPRHLHRQVIYSHFISHLTYGSPIWGKCISGKQISKLSSCLNKTLRQHCFDFTRSLHNSELYAQARIRSLKSQILIQDAKCLYRTVTQCSSFELAQRLTAQSSFSSRYPGRITFVDYGRRRVSRNSFVNRAKKINESIPFEWLDLTPRTFEVHLKRAIPMNIQ